MLRLSLVLLLFSVGASRGVAAEAPFEREVMAVLSRAGCNAGACHGNLNGKGGFRLSLRGDDPGFDLDAMTRHAAGRRVDLGHPDRSLILRKPTGQLPHEGGLRFPPGSPEARALRAW